MPLFRPHGREAFWRLGRVQRIYEKGVLGQLTDLAFFLHPFIILVLVDFTTEASRSLEMAICNNTLKYTSLNKSIKRQNPSISLPDASLCKYAHQCPPKKKSLRSMAP